jgi:2-dehydropantoate 2-reductase
MRILVLGAGVIGRAFAARLGHAGHEVTVAARAGTAAALRVHGIGVMVGDQVRRVPVAVTEDATRGGPYDLALVALRLDVLESQLATIAAIPTPVVVFLQHLGDLAPQVAALLQDRAVVAFPGLGGYLDPDGVLHHKVVGFGQPTTIDATAAHAKIVREVIDSAHLPTALEPDMRSWMATHTVFIAGIGAAILASGGVQPLAHDRAALNRMISAVRAGFHSLQRQGYRIRPAPLGLLFLRAPRLVGRSYWQRQLVGELGRLAMEPHALRTRDSEFRLICHEALDLLDHTGPRDPFRDLVTPFA